MKQDILIYLLLPPAAFVLTTITIAFVPLLNFMTISAQLSESNGNPPVMQYVVLMLVIYYATVAFIIRDSQRICQLNLQKLSLNSIKPIKSKYGQKTKQQIQKLQRSEQYQEYLKRKSNKNYQQSLKQNQKKKKIPFQVTNQQSEDDSDRENMLLGCHQIATTKKMF